MKKKQRKMLAQLCELCNQLGSDLDGTATNNKKYIERQKAHMLVYKVIYGVLVDETENPNRNYDINIAMGALTDLEVLTKKVYPDRNGNS